MVLCSMTINACIWFLCTIIPVIIRWLILDLIYMDIIKNSQKYPKLFCTLWMLYRKCIELWACIVCLGSNWIKDILDWALTILILQSFNICSKICKQARCSISANVSTWTQKHCLLEFNECPMMFILLY